MSRIYLDHAATTPMVPEAVEAMTRELTRVGNASSLHGSGRAARRVVEESREAIAARVGAQPAEVIFTSGGTEADNLAVKGGYWSGADSGRSPAWSPRPSSIMPCWIRSAGWRRTGRPRSSCVPVDRLGRIDLARWPRLSISRPRWCR